MNYVSLCTLYYLRAEMIPSMVKAKPDDNGTIPIKISLISYSLMAKSLGVPLMESFRYSSHFNYNKTLTDKLRYQVIVIINISKIYRRHCGLVEKI